MNSIANISLKDFEELFRSNYEGLCAHANKLLNDLDMSEEIVQGLFVKIWERKESLEFHSSVVSYLYTSVRNLAFNEIKHSKVKDEYNNYNKEQLDNSMVTVDEEVEAQELEDKIRISIESLPEARKQIFKLSRYEGLKYKEIAEKLNISVKTVENQMGSAIKQLKMDLSEYMLIITFVIISLLE